MQGATASSTEAQDVLQLLASGRPWLVLLQAYLVCKGGNTGGLQGLLIMEGRQGLAGSGSTQNRAGAGDGVGGDTEVGGDGMDGERLERALGEMVDQLETPAAEGTSFPRLFATALVLGFVSR